MIDKVCTQFTSINSLMNMTWYYTTSSATIAVLQKPTKKKFIHDKVTDLGTKKVQKTEKLYIYIWLNITINYNVQV